MQATQAHFGRFLRVFPKKAVTNCVRNLLLPFYEKHVKKSPKWACVACIEFYVQSYNEEFWPV